MTVAATANHVMRRHPRDQAARQSESGAPFVFGARHLAAVLFVIHAQQVQYAMQHQNLDLLTDAVAVLGRLALGVLEGDRNVAQEAERLSGRERQHVGGIILLAKVAVQPAQLRIARDQASEWAPTCHFRFQSLGERAGRQPAKSPAWPNGIAE